MAISRREFTQTMGALNRGASLRGMGGTEQGLSKAAIREILAARIDRQRNGVGLVAGVVAPNGRQCIGYGRMARDDPRTPDANTVFEIASLTKIFTGLIFAGMFQRGEIGLEDPLSRHLPGIALPERDGRAITLLDLATHTSGLPQFPDNPRLPPDAPADVFQWYLAMETYTEDDLFAFLAGYGLPRAPGAQWGYSNVGFALLGMALCRRAGMNFETLVTSRILRPLGMHDTAITPTKSMECRMATPHELNLRPVPRQQRSIFVPSGGLLSTANDLMTFLRALMPGARSPIAAANDLALATGRPGNEAGFEQAIGWEIRQVAGANVCWKPGGSRGCSSVLTYDRVTHKGVVVLGNSDYRVDDIGRHVLVPAAPLRRQFTAVDVIPELLVHLFRQLHARHHSADRYRAAGSRDRVAVRQVPPLALTAISEAAFLNPDANTEFRFRRDADGKVTGLTLVSEGQPPTDLSRVR